MATAHPLAGGPPTCRTTSPNLNKDARIRRRPDKDEDRDRLKVGESARASATGKAAPQRRGQQPPATPGGARNLRRGARPGHEAVNAAAPHPAPGGPAPGQRSPKDLTG